MSSHEREEELRKRLRLIHLLHQTNPYPTGPGTANQRRQRRRRWRKRWQQLLALADRIYSFPDPPTDTPRLGYSTTAEPCYREHTRSSNQYSRGSLRPYREFEKSSGLN
uniref:Protein Rev n=1 Tax=Simian immunodeficiency virus TaxID=11723 RepID=L7Z394_SIV|nr:rev protein [Simian immunodeficiency virus]